MLLSQLMMIIQDILSLKNMNERTPILAIETSDIICGACLFFDESRYYSYKLILKHSHSEKLFDAINIVMQQSGVNFVDIKSVAVSAGPGSFTGLRIGMAAAKGICQASMLPIFPVPTFEAMALQISEFLPENSRFIISNKVGKDELYFARFYIKSYNDIFQEELKIIRKSDLTSESGDHLIFGNALENEDRSKKISAPDPEYIAKWALINGKDKETINFDYLEPDYLKQFLIKEKKI